MNSRVHDNILVGSCIIWSPCIAEMHVPSLGSTSEHNTCLRWPNTCSCLNRSSFHEGLTECLAILFHQYVPRQIEINRFNLRDSTKTLHLERGSLTGSMYYGARGHISILSMYFKNFTNVEAFSCTTHYYCPTCGPGINSQWRLWPLAIKRLDTHF